MVKEGPKTSAGIRTVEEQYTADGMSCLFEQSPDLLCVVGLDGYLKRLNPAWPALVGWATDELRGKLFLEFIHRDDRENTAIAMRRLASGAATAVFENRFLHRNGSHVWLQWSAIAAHEQAAIYAAARNVTRQKWLETEVVRIADREMEHLGRELHDGVCQTLAGVAALSATLARKLAGDGQTVRSAEASEIAALLGEVIGQTHNLAHRLGPVGLGTSSLRDAIESLAMQVQQMHRVTCLVRCEDPCVRLPRDVKLHLFRITQEALSNAVIHGRADRIEVGLNCGDGRGVLSIRDNGVGIAEKECRSGGIGLHSMAARANLIGGELDVRRRAVQGTAVICTFPESGLPLEHSGEGDVPNVG